MSLVATCSSIDSNGVCSGAITYIDVYLLPLDSAPMLGLLLAGGFDAETAQLGFMGIMALFVAGLSVGIIVSMIRKLRI